MSATPLSRAALSHYLESLRRAGVTHVSQDAIAAAVARSPTPETVSKQLATAKPVPSPTPAASPVPPEPERRAVSNPAPVTSVAPMPKPETSQQRPDALKALADRVAACTRCQELAKSRTQTVFGVGNPDARIMFIGEAPGADEDRQGEPFVGRAGKLLNDIITACKMTREEIYICNILRCRPPGNRNPTPVEASNCREFLDGQIAIVDPDYIVCWGSVAAQNLLDTTSPIGRMRGQFYQHGRAKVLCTYHPSYLLRNPSAKKPVWDDMKFLFSDMGVEL